MLQCHWYSAGAAELFCAVSTVTHIDYENALRRLSANYEQQTRRIAQALHDEAGQLLTSAHIALDELALRLPTDARDQLNVVKQHLDRVEDQLRRLAHELRPRILDDIGLIPALEFLAEGVGKRWRVNVSIDAAVGRRLAATVETAVYRLVQEALNNATKHARPSRIAIALTDTAQALRCTIEDDGVGFDSSHVASPFDTQGLGLAGIRDHVEMMGGTLEIESAPRHGTRLTIVIPLEP